jgi:hypothetical protein
MSYAVGQVLYLLMHKEHTVIPVQVTEKILRTTREGDSISYIIELPTKNKDLRKLETIDALPYKDTDSIKVAMLESATKTIDAIIQKSIKAAKKFTPLEIEDQLSSEDVKNINSGTEGLQSVDVDLGDGVVGKISIDSLGAEVKNGRDIA